ncbi:hypothetical protein FKP32DRAFT_1558980 [Trametes sanguinea]|nr:hypothetical protein FKP32DRAFT_1558980 [Trametes sanguinea]
MSRKRSRTEDDGRANSHWFPWHNKITCTLDVLMHLPRSVFSQRQLDLFLWLLRVNGMEDVPSVRHMLKLNAALQRACGIDSIAYKGVLGHTYYVNALDQIIAQEMANPRVRPFLHFYPEDTRGRDVSEARQAARWLEEVSNDYLTPMVRLGEHDYYIYEPALRDDGTVCMPVRWLTRMEGGKRVWYAKCWEMRSVVGADSSPGWRIVQREDLKVCANSLLKNFPQLRSSAELYGMPDPCKIIDVLDLSNGAVSPWKLTDPAKGNPWRERAKGNRVLSFPLWMYCDDTSGNLSKKWNEHNSVLMTPAGLPRSHSQKEFNIHFLTTSNIAPPLEMMDGVVEQLEKAQHDGIWAWDCVLNEPVLVIPFVLALLGDNPMQSEFACHIGLQAKFFCRACWCKGRDVPDERARAVDGADSRNGSPEPSKGKTKGRAKKALEGMAAMVTRVTAFLQPGRPRSKQETSQQLRSYFDMASTPGAKSRVTKERTNTGIKDTFQLAHLDKLFAAYKNKSGYTAKQAAIAAAIEELPDRTTNPVWRLGELDAHSDTPVEVLHVVLLGFVKYFWRDLVQGQLKTNDAKKELLATRLSSLDVSALGLSPLGGKTLVQYAGSLTGRDFRAIAQVAPFVVYDMVTPECYEAWVALSKLAPLIWQPHIKDMKSHLTLLEKEIKYFLLCTARWTVRWFNKPKFHILLHLVEHVRRFGPAGLFATEAFESFNAVIRAESVHSNRQAPSRDIARAFAQANRIRHLLSGGYFVWDHKRAEDSVDGSASQDTDLPNRRTFMFERSAWKTVGVGPQSLVHDPGALSCKYDKEPPKPLSLLKTGTRLPEIVPMGNGHTFKASRSMVLVNGDSCAPGQFVIAKAPGRPEDSIIGRVEEILTRHGSLADMAREPEDVLLQVAHATREARPYRMPYIDLQDRWLTDMVVIQDILCTVATGHDCAGLQCADTGRARIREERELTAAFKPVIEHRGEPAQGLILNTAQWRDALYVQRYRLPSPLLHTEDIVLAAVAREIDGRKPGGDDRTQTTSKSGSGRGRGGQGGSGGSRSARGGRARGRGTPPRGQVDGRGPSVAVDTHLVANQASNLYV